jgi:hypothetical protein
MVLNYASAVTSTPVRGPAPVRPPASSESQNSCVSVTKEGQESDTLVPVVNAVTEPSICISRIPLSFNDGQLRDIVEQMKLGKVSKIDLINKTDRSGNDYLMAFIHFDSWETTGPGGDVRTQLMNDEKLKIVYDDPEFLMMSKSYTSKNGKKGKSQKRELNMMSESTRTEKKPREKVTQVVDDDGETWNVLPSAKSAKKQNTSSSNVDEEYNETFTPSQRKQNAFAGLTVYNEE